MKIAIKINPESFRELSFVPTSKLTPKETFSREDIDVS